MKGVVLRLALSQLRRSVQKRLLFDTEVRRSSGDGDHSKPHSSRSIAH
jgi:hypothetical protein